MNKQRLNNLKLGIFVVAGTAVLVTTLYLLGSKRNLFGSTIEINAIFKNVNGLLPGNNVRYGGINIGTVEKILIKNDSTIFVRMVVNKDAGTYINKNAIVSIGTDGLMGNKLLNINASAATSVPLEEGDTLISRVPIETDDMMRTLNTTNDNLAIITTDLKNLTQKINRPNGIISILSDSGITNSVRQSILEFQRSAINVNAISAQVAEMVRDVEAGKGVLGTLTNDTSSTAAVKRILVDIRHASDSLVAITKEFGKFSNNLNDANGLVYTLSKDTAMTAEFKSTMKNINQSSSNLNENLKAMRSNFLFRKYFRKQEKNQK